VLACLRTINQSTLLVAGLQIGQQSADQNKQQSNVPYIVTTFQCSG